MNELEKLIHPDGTTITLVDQSAEHHNEYLLIEHKITKLGAINGPHWHPELTEYFTVKEGKMRIKVDGEDFILLPGQHCKVSPRQIHQFWNESSENLTFLHEVRPPGKHWNMFKLIHKLDEKNQLNSKGIPRNPLWLSMAWECMDGYLDGIPPVIQRIVFGNLARFARAIGYRI
ncbi:hypothetical protein BTS2_2928 [Bacillus sp. TS-2]|nr:hypothetical protein BTS2_2928 [Bacillus sp. TS-2]